MRFSVSLLLCLLLPIATGCVPSKDTPTPDAGQPDAGDDRDGSEEEPPPTFGVGGTLSGLNGTVVLRNGPESLSLSENGDFHFTEKVEQGASYAVHVEVQPEAQTCSLTRHEGTVADAAVTDITVRCGPPYFTEPTLQLEHPNPVGVVATGDLDGDGRLELVYVDGRTVIVMAQREDGGFEELQRLSSAEGAAYAIAMGDVDGDGDLDVIAAGHNLKALFINDGGHLREEVSLRPLFARNFNTYELAMGDLNGDGVTDVVGGSDGMLWIAFGPYQAGAFASAPIESSHGLEGDTVALTMADVDSDGDVDLVHTVYDRSVERVRLFVRRNDGVGTLGAPIDVGFSSHPVLDGTEPYVLGLRTGDFNGDGKSDLAVLNAGFNGKAGLFVGLRSSDDGAAPTYTFSELSSEPAGALAVGDFNGDGLLDLMGGAPSGGGLHLGNGDGTFHLHPMAFPYAYDFHEADLDGDGKLDLLYLDLEGYRLLRGI